MEINYERYCFEGTDSSRACKPRAHSIQPSDSESISLDLLSDLQSSSSKWSCSLHGKSCMGHIERVAGIDSLMIPSSMIPSDPLRISPYELDKKLLCSDKITDIEYKKITEKLMKGKKGSVRSINNLVKEGSARMVISPWSHRVINTIIVPEFVCRNISIPDISQRFISKSQISHCSSAILIRQPVLWVGER